MKKVSSKQAGFTVVGLIIIIFTLASIGVIGYFVATRIDKKDTSVPSNSSMANGKYSSSLILYNLPYVYNKTPVAVLLETNQINTSVTDNAIKLSFIPNKPVDNMYVISGRLLVNKTNSEVTKKIEIEITEQLYTGVGSNTGLDITIGNQGNYDDSYAPNAKLTHGSYQLSVNVSDTKGNKLHAYKSTIMY